MSLSKDLFGEVKEHEGGSFPIDPQRVLERKFEFEDTVMFLHCKNCGNTYEITENFRREAEKDFSFSVENDNQYLEVESCHVCSGKPRISGATLQEVSIN